MKELKVISLYFFLIVNLFSGLHLEAKSIVSGDIVEGQAYQPNFLKQKGHFEKNANGTTAYADAAGTRPVDGSGGVPTLTCTRTTSSPIDGDGSLLITKDAANRQGQGCSIQFTIDSAYKAKVLQIEFDYLVASGTFTAGSSSSDSDLIVYIYDVTNSTLIEPSSIKLLSNSTTISDHFVANFQTSATGTTYNLILHQATTSASAYTVKADNFEVKPSKYVYGTPISDWVSYTPTGGWTGSVAYNGKWRRVGDNLEVSAQVALSGAPTGTTLSFNHPNSFAVDTSKLPSDLSRFPLGDAVMLDTGTQTYRGNVFYNNTTSVIVNSFNAASTTVVDGIVNTTTPFTFGNTDLVTITYRVPITGWSSSTQVSDGYDGRLIAALAHKNASDQTGVNPNASFVKITFGSTASSGGGYDQTASFDTTNSKFTAPSSGKYSVKSNITLSAANILADEYALALYKNGSFYKVLDDRTQASTTVLNLQGSTSLDLIAGDYLELYLYGNGNNSASTLTITGNVKNTYFAIEKLSSPQTMSATETTVFYTYTGSPTGTLNGSYNTTTFGTSGTFYDTHGNYSSGVYTFRDPGCYHSRASVQLTHSTAAGYLDVGLSYNNSAPFIADYKYVNGSGDTTQNVSGVICVRSGDTLRVQTKTNLTTPAYSSNAPYNYFIISKIK